MYRFDCLVSTFRAMTSGPYVRGDTGFRCRPSSCRYLATPALRTRPSIAVMTSTCPDQSIGYKNPFDCRVVADRPCSRTAGSRESSAGRCDLESASKRRTVAVRMSSSCE